MRVPVYQQQVTPQIPGVRSQVGVPDGAAGVAVKPIDTTAGIAQGVESLRLGLVKMQENRDKFMLASAVNEYRRSNTQFLHAKDTGVFAKKGKDVFGISQQYDEFSSKTMEDIAKRYKMSGAARDRFVEATSALYNASLSSVMTHEQRETDAAQQQEWKAMASDTLSNIALCYADDNAFNENVQFGLSAISQQWEPYGDQVRDSKMREYLSQCQVQRVAAMLEESPKAAGAYLEKHKGDFAGDDYLKVKKAVDNKLDVIKVQETTDVLVKKFRGNEQAALQYIHKNYEGDMENKMISSVKSRFSEMKIRDNRGAIARTGAQNEVFKGVKKFLGDGGVISEDQLAQLNLTDEQKAYVRAHNEQNMRFENILAHGEKFFSGWGDMSEDERHVYAARAAGITDTERSINVLNLAHGLEDGTKSLDDVKASQKRGEIIPSQGKMLKQAYELMQSVNAGVFTNIKTAMNKNLDLIAQETPVLQDVVDNAKRDFLQFAAVQHKYNNTGGFEKTLSNEASRVLLDLIDKQLKDQNRDIPEGTQAVYEIAQRMKDRNYGSSWIEPAAVAGARKTAGRVPLVTRSGAARYAAGGSPAPLSMTSVLDESYPAPTVSGGTHTEIPYRVDITRAEPGHKQTAEVKPEIVETRTVRSNGMTIESAGSDSKDSALFPDVQGVSVRRPMRGGQNSKKEMTKEEIAAMAAEFGKRRFSGGDEKKGGGK